MERNRIRASKGSAISNRESFILFGVKDIFLYFLKSNNSKWQLETVNSGKTDPQEFVLQQPYQGYLLYLNATYTNPEPP